MSALKLDLGAGEISPPGFVPVGRDHGTEIFPLPYADGSVEEIRASHVLEHFPHRQVDAVIKDWVRALKKGGRLRIAVPNFAKIAEDYLQGRKAPHESYLLGAQIDKNDFHHSMFDRERLRELFAAAGLVIVRPWISEINDCAAYDISLNLEGYKPHVPEIKVSGAMSVPRLGFMNNFFCAFEAMLPCHVKMRKHGGAFWGQAMENVFERILEEDDADAILTLDYDTVFLPKHLAHLMQLMMLYPEVDALAPIQSSRHLKSALFTVKSDSGDENVPSVSRETFEADVRPVDTAHFGLTLIRTEKIRSLPKPWFQSVPSPQNDWRDGHVDEDIMFWRKFTAAGSSLFLANRVAIGHMELAVRWPNINLEAIHQPIKEWDETGAPPEGVWA